MVLPVASIGGHPCTLLPVVTVNQWTRTVRYQGHRPAPFPTQYRSVTKLGPRLLHQYRTSANLVTEPVSNRPGFYLVLHGPLPTELSQELVQKQILGNVDEIIDKLFSEVSCLDSQNAVKIQEPQVEESAINLWNWAVTEHVGSAINGEQRAKVRHVACRLAYACETSDPKEGAIRRQILMAIKTGRSWLDTKKPASADVFFSLAVKNLELLYGRLKTRSDGQSDLNIPKGDVEKDLFRVHSYQAESAVAQADHQQAVSYVQRCKDMLLRLPKETGYLSLMCYNFGVDTYNLKKYEESSFWLSQSYDIGKMHKKYSPGASVQAKILRLLANVYMEWDCKQYREKALSAVSLANKENVHPAGLYLKINILLQCVSPDEPVKAAIAELLDVEVPLDVCLNTVKLLMDADREVLAFEFLKSVCKHFEASPELGRAQVQHIKMLLQRGKELLGKQKIEDIITVLFFSPQRALCDRGLPASDGKTKPRRIPERRLHFLYHQFFSYIPFLFGVLFVFASFVVQRIYFNCIADSQNQHRIKSSQGECCAMQDRGEKLGACRFTLRVGLRICHVKDIPG
ncbi:UNVERIFIED_CONTAM: hypothetical protein FKN15_067631 [Acipenser sinensis]